MLNGTPATDAGSTLARCIVAYTPFSIKHSIAYRNRFRNGCSRDGYWWPDSRHSIAKHTNNTVRHQLGLRQSARHTYIHTNSDACVRPLVSRRDRDHARTAACGHLPLVASGLRRASTSATAEKHNSPQTCRAVHSVASECFGSLDLCNSCSLPANHR